MGGSIQFLDAGNGTFHIDGGLTLGACDTTTLNLGAGSSPVAGTNYDQIVVCGGSNTISLNGTLVINTLPDLSAGDGTTFTIIDNETGNPISGTFTGLPDNSTFTVNGWTFSITYEGGSNSQSVQLTVVNAPTFTSPYLIENADDVTLSGLDLANGVQIVNSHNITLSNDTIGGAGNPFDGVYVDGASSNITISNDTIAGNGGAGVDILGSNVLVSNNYIDGNFKGGVLINSGSSDTISGNTIGDGINLLGASNIVIQGNYIGVDSAGTALNNPSDGIYVDSASSNITIGGTEAGQGNTIAYNGGYGVDIQGTDVTVSGNTIANDSFAGVLVNGGSGVDINNNTIGDGVSLTGAASVTVQGNYIGVNASGTPLGNQLNGVYVDPASTDISINNDTIASNGGYGIAVTASDVSVSGNTISNDSFGGVLISGSDSDSITTNTIGDGVTLYGATNTVIQSNYIGVNAAGTALGNPNDGIYADSASSNLTISDNTIAFNGGAGVNLEASDSVVSGNSIANDSFGGVLVAGSDGDSISDNTIGDGVTLYGATNTVIQNNYIGVNAAGTSLGNPNDGIYVDPSSSTITVSGNTIAHNGGAGVNLAGSTIAVTGNDFSDNSTADILVAGGSGVTLDGNTLDSLIVAPGSAAVTEPATLPTITLGSTAGAGTLTADGDFDQAASDQLFIALGGGADPVAGTDYSQLVVSGSGDDISLAGTLNLNVLPTLTAPLGTVFTLLDNQTGTPISGTFSGLAEGSDITVDGWTFSITYVGGPNNDDVQLTVLANPTTTTTTLTSSLNPAFSGQNVTFTAVVAPYSGSGTPTGTVAFYDGTTLLGTVAVNSSGDATLTLSTLLAGTHSITAVYSGDSSWSGSTSAVLWQTIIASA